MSTVHESVSSFKPAPESLMQSGCATDIFPSWPSFAEDEVEAASAVLRSGKVNYWTGTQGRLFEGEFAEFVGCRYAVAVSSGTVALELALRGIGVGTGEEVIVPSRTFVATASAVVAAGARPVFADVDSNSQCLTAETIRPLISVRTRAIIAVHLGGWPCDMDAINELAEAHGITVLEDCAQAQGATYKGRQVGTLGKAAAFSFCQDKIMTTGGEGGMVTTDDREIWERMWSYKDHGKHFDAVPPGPSTAKFRWLHDSFGTNWRMTEMQSAIGRLQLRKVSAWLSTRNHHAECLRKRLSKLPGLRIPVADSSLRPAWYRFYVFIRPDLLLPARGQDFIAEAIRSEGVPCAPGTCSEVYLEKAFPAEWKPFARLPVARDLGETSLAFPLHPTLESCHIRRTCEIVERVLSTATKDAFPIPSSPGLYPSRFHDLG